MAIKKALLGMILGALLIPCSQSYANTYDVLKLPAEPSPLAAKAPLFVIKKFGNRYYAAGEHGHILYSDDNGKTWVQGKVPVRSTLLDVDFVNDKQGWAVGHEGVILHTSDGGDTWELMTGISNHASMTNASNTSGAGSAAVTDSMPLDNRNSR